MKGYSRQSLFGAASSVGLAVGVLCLGTGAASAQTAQAGASEQGVADIVVTAQRRTERLQDVPVAVTAVTADTLARRGLTSATDLNMATPNLNVSRTVKTQLVYLRGVGNSSTAAGQEQNVAIYVDGVYLPDPAANVFSFNNIERIEVLRGPQGTLFGRNTTGGLVQVITKDPTQELSGQVSAGVANYSTASLEGYVAGGLSDTLRVGVAAQYKDQARGWGKNLVTGGDVSKAKSFGARGKAIWEPSSSTKLTFSGLYYRQTSDIGSARTILPCAQRLNGQSCVPINAGIPGFSNLPYTGFYNVQLDTPTLDHSRIYVLSGRLDQDLGFARFVNITGYTNSVANELLDNDGVPAFRTRSTFNTATTSISNETQLLSQSDSKLQWIAGVYYFWSVAKTNPLIVMTPTSQSVINDRLTTSSVAPFAQLTYPLGDNTKITLGARYTSDVKAITGTIVNGLTGATLANADQRKTFTRTTFRASIDHHITKDVLLYALVSTGFKSGLFNATSPTQTPVNPEKLTDFEGGLKMDLFDRRVRLNLAGFYYDYKDLQLIIYNGSTTRIQNATTAKIWGIEAEGQVKVTPNFSLNGSLGYTHARYGSFVGAGSNSVIDPVTGLTTAAPTGVDASGNKLARTPTFTGNIGADFTIPVSFGTLDLSGTFYHNSGFFWEADNRVSQKAYNLANFSAAVNLTNGLSVQAWVNNAFKTKYLTVVSTGNAQLDQGSPGAPRTYGVTIGYKF